MCIFWHLSRFLCEFPAPQPLIHLSILHAIRSNCFAQTKLQVGMSAAPTKKQMTVSHRVAYSKSMLFSAVLIKSMSTSHRHVVLIPAGAFHGIFTNKIQNGTIFERNEGKWMLRAICQFWEKKAISFKRWEKATSSSKTSRDVSSSNWRFHRNKISNKCSGKFLLLFLKIRMSQQHYIQHRNVFEPYISTAALPLFRWKWNYEILSLSLSLSHQNIHVRLYGVRI